jgi:histidinol dehydrogenase
VVNPLVLLAARIAGVDEIYRIGGAQAVAALAYGTETIAPVDKITGPGNAYVAAAKRRVFGKVGIDMIAGPSEILVIADADNDPDWIALDLLSQAEHDESAQSILITTDAGFGKAVAEAVDKRLETLERRAIAGAKLARFRRDHHRARSGRGGGAVQPDRARAPRAVRGRPRRALRGSAHAGAIFLGPGRPRPSATTSAGPTTCCPRRARRGSPPGCR